MKSVLRKWNLAVLCCLSLVCVVGSLALTRANAPSADGSSGFSPTNSSTIAISADDQFIWIVNQDVNAVSVIRVAGDAYELVAQIPVGNEPRTIALTPNYAFVANMVDGTVSVISTTTYGVVNTIPVGTEPYGVAVTPNSSKVYVANASSNTVSVLSTTPPVQVINTIGNVGADPRGIGITADGSRVFVTQFFARFRTGIVPGSDNEKEGRVTVINGVTDTVIGQLTLDPMPDTGFNANGNALARIAPPGGDPTRPPFNQITGAYPNQLQSIAILGNRAYLPNTAASPNGPVRFNVNAHGFLSVFNILSLQHEAQNTINLNRGIQFEPSSPNKIFMSSPWALAFKHQPRKDGIVEGWGVMAASDIAVKVEVNPATGRPTINAPTMPGDPGNVKRLDVGSAPRGIVINSSDTRAYVMNYVSRDVSVIDLQQEALIATLQSWPQPAPGTLERVVHEGKRLFFTSRGPTFVSGESTHFRMSREGWGSCIACHEDGRDDGVTWIFAAGPRRTVNLAHSFSHDPSSRRCAPSEPCSDQRVLNWTAIFDELDDFELNSRTVFGANDPREDNPVLGGLITLADRVTPEVTGNILAFFSAGIPQQNGFRPQFEISDGGAQGIRAQNAIARFVQLGIRNRISPVPTDDKISAAGRLVFQRLNCLACHSGPKWTISRVVTRPPAVSDVQAGQFRPILREVGTFDPNGVNEVTAVAGVPQGAFGFNPPSLLGGFANSGGWFHNSGALSLNGLLTGTEGCVGPDPANCVHNVLGTTTAEERAALIQFLRSIDERTEAFPIP